MLYAQFEREMCQSDSGFRKPLSIVGARPGYQKHRSPQTTLVLKEEVFN